MDNQLRCTGFVTPEERAHQAERIRVMKADLTTTNFRLGDETPHYQSVNHESMALIQRHRDESPSRTNGVPNVKEAVKKSSIHFGNEKINYRTVAHESMEYSGKSIETFDKLKEEVKLMKQTLTKHNFSFGDEKVDYVSDYHRGYSDNGIPMEAYSAPREKKQQMRSIIEDSRRCHFQLGNDRPVYESNTHQALRIIEGHSASDVSKQLEQAKDMKQALQRTSIVIGDDAEYY
jgi:hypothetical protein